MVQQSNVTGFNATPSNGYAIVQTNAQGGVGGKTLPTPSTPAQVASSNAGVPVMKTLTGGAGISITDSAGALTVVATAGSTGNQLWCSLNTHTYTGQLGSVPVSQSITSLATAPQYGSAGSSVAASVSIGSGTSSFIVSLATGQTYPTTHSGVMFILLCLYTSNLPTAFPVACYLVSNTQQYATTKSVLIRIPVTTFAANPSTLIYAPFLYYQGAATGSPTFGTPDPSIYIEEFNDANNFFPNSNNALFVGMDVLRNGTSSGANAIPINGGTASTVIPPYSFYGKLLCSCTPNIILAQGSLPVHINFGALAAGQSLTVLPSLYFGTTSVLLGSNSYLSPVGGTIFDSISFMAIASGILFPDNDFYGNYYYTSTGNTTDSVLTVNNWLSSGMIPSTNLVKGFSSLVDRTQIPSFPICGRLTPYYPAANITVNLPFYAAQETPPSNNYALPWNAATVVMQTDITLNLVNQEVVIDALLSFALNGSATGGVEFKILFFMYIKRAAQANTAFNMIGYTSKGYDTSTSWTTGYDTLTFSVPLNLPTGTYTVSICAATFNHSNLPPITPSITMYGSTSGILSNLNGSVLTTTYYET